MYACNETFKIIKIIILDIIIELLDYIIINIIIINYIIINRILDYYYRKNYYFKKIQRIFVLLQVKKIEHQIPVTKLRFINVCPTCFEFPSLNIDIGKLKIEAYSMIL